MKTLSKYLFIFYLLIFAACEKDKPVPNNPTPTPTPPKEKTNYMEAKVDGVYWEDCAPSIIGHGEGMSGQYFPNSEYIDIQGTQFCYDSIHTSIFIELHTFTGIGTYYLGENYLSSGGFDLYTSPVTSFITDFDRKGFVAISKFDLTRKTISGTFEFQAYNADSNKVVVITEGKFNEVNFYTF